MKIMIMLVAILAISAPSSEAFTYRVNSRSESSYQNIKRAAIDGTYTLDANEVLQRVQFTHNVGFVQGNWTNSAPFKWSTSYGDPDLRTYQIDFTVRNLRTNIVRKYSTSKYTWGR